MKDEYVRAVRLVEVIDGDTFRCDVDLGFYVTVRMLCRLAGINCPDRGEGGYLEAKEALAEILGRGTVTVASVRPDKYAGRFDAVVTVAGFGDVVWSVNQSLVDRGYAVNWDGTGKRPIVPWPPVVSGA